MDRKSKILLAVGGVFAFFVALPLFIFAVLSPSGTFEIRNRAQEATPMETATPSASPTTTSCLPSDINQDGITDVSDYTVFASDFFKSPPANLRSDMNLDGIVDITDYSILVSKFFVETGACQ